MQVESTNASIAQMTFVSDGAASNPAIGATDDTAFNIQTGNLERLRVDASGNVGIGTSSMSAKMVINQASSSDALIIQRAAGVSGNTTFSFPSADSEIDATNNMRLATGGTERVRIDGTGRLLVNTAQTANYGQTTGDSNWIYRTESGAVIQAQDADTTFSMMYMNKYDWNNTKDGRFIAWYKNGVALASISLTSGGIVSYGTGSDYRLKKNVTDMTGGITRIKQINPKQFNLIADPDDTTMDGFLAHELATVIPEAVVGSHNEVKSRTNAVRNSNGNLIEDGVTQEEWTQGKVDGVYPSDSNWSASFDEPIYQNVDYGKVTPLLVAALKEAIAKIETLENKVAALENA